MSEAEANSPIIIAADKSATAATKESSEFNEDGGSEFQESRKPRTLEVVRHQSESHVGLSSDDSTSNHIQANTVESFLSEIESAWNRTVQDIVEVGKVIKRAKGELGASYKQLVQRLPFSASEAGNFVRVSEHPVLSDPAYWNSLPRALNTLYYLSRLGDSHVQEAIGSGAISPDTTLSQAKALVSGQIKTVGGRQARSDSADYMDVTVSIPRNSDVSAVLKAAQAMVGNFGGTIDYYKNETSVGEFFLKDAKAYIERCIDATKDDLKNATFEQMRMLEQAAETLSKVKAKKGDPEPKLPDDNPDTAALMALLGVQEITSATIKTWCVANDVPNRLGLDKSDQPVYVWEQARLIVEKQDEKAARKRLEQISRGKNRTICRLAFDIMDGLDNMANFESQFS
jgi:hypothetical protein